MLLAGEGWQREFQSIDQPGQSSEVERNPKMSISFFLGGEGWWMGFESINQPSQSSEFEQNAKMSISFFWLERGSRWGLSPSTSPADYQDFNIIQKWGFHFFGWKRVVDGVWVHQPVWPTSEVECNTKMSISFFCLERGGRWGSSPSTSLADHQKLNVIEKSAFHFFGWRGVADGVQVHQLVQSIIRSECNPKMSILFFGWRAVVAGVRVHWPAQPIIRSWT